MQHNFLAYHIVAETIVAKPQAELPLTGLHAQEFSNVGAALQIEGVRLEEFKGLQQSLVNPRETLAQPSNLPLERAGRDDSVACRHGLSGPVAP